MKRCCSIAILALCSAACNGGDTRVDATEQSDTAPAAPVPMEPQFATELGVDLAAMTQTTSGVHYLDVRRGTGATATAGKNVVIEYSAWLPDGTLFEKRPNTEGWGAAQFILGESAPVPGLSDAIEGMRTGGIRRIVVPPERGYGLVGRPEAVPRNSTLVFEVKLTNVRDN